MSKDDKSKTVYFVRHGQSIDNTRPVFQSPDNPLSELGEKQASVVADRLKDIEFDVLISSTFPRAKQTSVYISKTTGKKPTYEKLFVERIKPSSIDAKPWTDPEASKIWRSWEETLYKSGAKLYDGESYDDIVLRADNALTYLEKHPASTIVVVTHGYFLRVMLSRILLGDNLNGEIMKRFQELASIENTGITTIKFQNVSEENYAWKLWSYNDHSHLI
jgi:probable phosphoglycerate mutase